MSIPLSTNAAQLMQQYHDSTPCTWCDGCGDYGIWTAVKRALSELGIPPHEVLLCYDVGCHGNGSDKIRAYTFHGLHGRVIPFAAGAKLANPNIPVIAFGGDGASFSEGIGHLIHSVRSNYPITFVLHNNANYGLTTGQASSLTWQDQPMNTSPNGIPEQTLRSMDLVFSLEPTFVARAWSGDVELMTKVLKEGIKHQKHGFAFVDILQSCPTYNHFATHEYLLERCYDITERRSYDLKNFEKARKIANDTEKKIACGVLYQRKNVPSFYNRLLPRKDRKTTAVEEVKKFDVTKLIEELV